MLILLTRAYNMISLPNLELESSLTGRTAGIDEAGRGPLAGPVVAAAVLLNQNFKADGINDSKKLSSAQRNTAYAKITEECHYGIGIATIEEIEDLNILQATLLAMQRASAAIHYLVDGFLIDGNVPPIIKDKTIKTLVGGDSKSLSIAAASIVAKVTRDRIMLELDQEYPQYQWHKNFGYGTKAHRDALLNFGPCKWHRKLFIRKILNFSATQFSV